MKRKRKPQTPCPVRLLLVDRHVLFTEGLRQLFDDCEEVEELATATNEQDAPRAARRIQPDVILLDPWMNGDGPFALLRRLRQAAPKARFVFLEDGVQETHVRVALRVRAGGFFTKFCSFAEIRRAVQEAAAGRTAYCTSVQHYVVKTPRGPRFNRAERTSTLGSLTQRELEVAILLADGYTVKEAARQMEVAVSTVDNHKTRLMKKLNVHKTVELAKLVLREGLLD